MVAYWNEGIITNGKSMEEPLVSIIVRTYNRAYCLKKALDSIINQTYRKWEVILVDNHSIDGTLALVDEYRDERIKKYLINNEGIIAASTNLGLNHSRGDYIAFLDSDDWWLPSKLEQSVKALREGADLIYHGCIQIREDRRGNIQKRKYRFRQVRSPVLQDLLLYGNAISSSSVVVKKELMDKVGGFSEDREIIAAEDYETWLRISKHTEKFKMLDDCLFVYSWGADNLSSSDKTIRHCHRIINLYDNEIRANSISLPTWLTYNLAISYYKVNSKKKAYRYACKTFWTVLSKIASNPSMIIILTKTIALLVLCLAYDSRKTKVR